MADQGNEGLLSPFLRRQRICAARPHLKGRVLDYGCGSGSLATCVLPDSYLGVDRDAPSLTMARLAFPKHTFVSESSAEDGGFETVVALAVIEHVEDPCGFLKYLAGFLSDSPTSSIVITTPHPAMDWVHGVGARLGIFSRHANEEHQELLDFQRLSEVGAGVGLRVSKYSRFLFGANQLAIFSKNNS
jgi:2-polyprenyl-3-methyl-5-hydroxy-6-metoxy-1,4-benzoquinol methylase